MKRAYCFTSTTVQVTTPKTKQHPLAPARHIHSTTCQGGNALIVVSQTADTIVL